MKIYTLVVVVALAAALVAIPALAQGGKFDVFTHGNSQANFDTYTDGAHQYRGSLPGSTDFAVDRNGMRSGAKCL